MEKILTEIACFIVLFTLGCSADSKPIGGIDKTGAESASETGAAGAGGMTIPAMAGIGTSGTAGMLEVGTGGATGTTGENGPAAGTGGPFWPVAGQAGSLGGGSGGNGVIFDAGIAGNNGNDPDGAVLVEPLDAGATCELPEDNPGDCHAWECEGDTAIEVIDDTDAPPFDLNHPLWSGGTIPRPNCYYSACVDGRVVLPTRPDCYIEYNYGPTPGSMGACFYCYGGIARSFDCSDPNASDAWKTICPDA